MTGSSTHRTTRAVVFALAAACSFAPVAVFAADPPYQAKLLRLSEILGSVHFLRTLCGESGTTWRDAMAGIIESEKPLPERKAALTASFNHGYRSFQGVYLRCTPQATAAISRYMKEGEALSADIAGRYGN